MFNPAWTDGDTIKLKSEAFQIAVQMGEIYARVDRLQRVLAQNEIKPENLNDEDPNGNPLGPIPKAQIWDLMAFFGTMELMLTGQEITGDRVAAWGAVLGKISKV